MEETRVCNTCNQELAIYKFYNGYKNGKRKLIRKCHHCTYKTKSQNNPRFFTRRHLASRYKMTLEEYDDLVYAQEGRCAICDEKSEALTVDHDHSCCPDEYTCGNCIRGLLCHKCNRGIGQFNDREDLLERAIAYLKNKTPR